LFTRTYARLRLYGCRFTRFFWILVNGLLVTVTPLWLPVTCCSCRVGLLALAFTLVVGVDCPVAPRARCTVGYGWVLVSHAGSALYAHALPCPFTVTTAFRRITRCRCRARACHPYGLRVGSRLRLHCYTVGLDSHTPLYPTRVTRLVTTRTVTLLRLHTRPFPVYPALPPHYEPPWRLRLPRPRFTGYPVAVLPATHAVACGYPLVGLLPCYTPRAVATATLRAAHAHTFPTCPRCPLVCLVWLVTHTVSSYLPHPLDYAVYGLPRFPVALLLHYVALCRIAVRAVAAGWFCLPLPLYTVGLLVWFAGAHAVYRHAACPHTRGYTLLDCRVPLAGWLLHAAAPRFYTLPCPSRAGWTHDVALTRVTHVAGSGWLRFTVIPQLPFLYVTHLATRIIYLPWIHFCRTLPFGLHAHTVYIPCGWLPHTVHGLAVAFGCTFAPWLHLGSGLTLRCRLLRYFPTLPALPLRVPRFWLRLPHTGYGCRFGYAPSRFTTHTALHIQHVAYRLQPSHTHLPRCPTVYPGSLWFYWLCLVGYTWFRYIQFTTGPSLCPACHTVTLGCTHVHGTLQQHMVVALYTPLWFLWFTVALYTTWFLWLRLYLCTHPLLQLPAWFLHPWVVPGCSLLACSTPPLCPLVRLHQRFNSLYRLALDCYGFLYPC